MRSIPMRCAAEALKQPAVAVAGSLCAALSSALWNPLPLILFALAATALAVQATTSEAHRTRAREAERRERRAAEEHGRSERLIQLEALFARARGASLELPDYGARYQDLEDLRARALQSASERGAAFPEWEVELAFDRLLGEFLDLALQRLQLRCALEGDGRARDLGATLERLRAELRSLEGRAQRAPAVAAELRAHGELKRRRLEQLEQAFDRDQRLAAQLEAMPDSARLLLESLAVEGGGEEVGLLAPIDEGDLAKAETRTESLANAPGQERSLRATQGRG